LRRRDTVSNSLKRCDVSGRRVVVGNKETIDQCMHAFHARGNVSGWEEGSGQWRDERTQEMAQHTLYGELQRGGDARKHAEQTSWMVRRCNAVIRRLVRGQHGLYTFELTIVRYKAIWVGARLKR
jgi:hypothetical protein